MKTCARCKEDKPKSSFSLKRADKGYLQPYCAPCAKEHKKEWYKRNKKKVRENTVIHQKRNKQFVLEWLLSHPCVDCGESDPVVLEFDHVTGIKRENVTTMMRKGCSLETLQNEISKCEIVCANCHKRRTYKGSFRCMPPSSSQV